MTFRTSCPKCSDAYFSKDADGVFDKCKRCGEGLVWEEEENGEKL